jgi:hypothetical protein
VVTNPTYTNCIVLVAAFVHARRNGRTPRRHSNRHSERETETEGAPTFVPQISANFVCLSELFFYHWGCFCCWIWSNNNNNNNNCRWSYGSFVAVLDLVFLRKRCRFLWERRVVAGSRGGVVVFGVLGGAQRDTERQRQRQCVCVCVCVCVQERRTRSFCLSFSRYEENFTRIMVCRQSWVSIEG